jgi:hypothetical protein
MLLTYFIFQLNGTHKFILGNIHVLFNPKRGDIKLGQVLISASFIAVFFVHISILMVMAIC